MLICNDLDILAKRKEKEIVHLRKSFGKRNDDEKQVEAAYRILMQGQFLDDERAWGLGITRLSEKIGRLRHGAYRINGKNGDPLKIVQWAPEEGKERCIYALLSSAPFRIQQQWDWLNNLSRNQLMLYDYNNKEYFSNDIPGQMSFADFEEIFPEPLKTNESVAS